LNKPAIHILCGVLTEATYEEVTEALENRYGDHHHLEAAFHLQLKGAQFVKKSLQKSASAIDHLAHSAPVELPEHLICKEAANAFAAGIRKREIRLLLLGHKKTLSKAFNQTLELETGDIADHSG
jgi:hypothetical protein